MKLKNIFWAGLVLATTVFASCQSDDSVSESEQISENEALLNELSNVTDIIVELSIGTDQETVASAPALKSSPATLPLVEVTFPDFPALWPREVTIDFGTANVDCVVGNPDDDHPFSVKARGKVTVVQTGPLYVTDTERSVSYDGFYVNDYHVEGETQFVNNGLNANGNYEFNWTATLKVTGTNGHWVSRGVSKVREMVSGASTPLYVWDDAFLVNGTAVGTSSLGWSYDHTLTDVLIKRTCRFPVSGTVEVNNSEASFVIDYGNGECDNEATLTNSDGNMVVIKLDKY
ncbi:MAG: hypothetical protein QM786_17490 [Breznakibacter sp.]